ncbi:MAG TPA: hypothetical protein VF530_07480 [Planctomycetota bacterium]
MRSDRSPVSRLVVPALALAALLAGPVEAQRRKLNGPLARSYFGEVGAYAQAAGRIVYAVQDGGTVLYRVPADGSAPASEIHASAASVAEFALVADGSRVVLRAALDLPGVIELYTLPADGSGAPVRLSAPLAPGEADVVALDLSPDGAFAVYRTVDGGGATAGLYAVRTDGSTPAVLLHGPFQADTQRITPDSAQVLFLANGQLLASPLEGSTPAVSVHPPAPAFADVAEFALAADGGRVVYRMDFDEAGTYELYSRPLDLSGPQVELSGPLVAGGDVVRFRIDPASALVTYVADQETDGTNALYVVPIGGGTATRLVTGMAGRDVLEAELSPDGTHLVYRANHGAQAGRQRLYSVPVDGSQPPLDLTAGVPGQTVRFFLTEPASGRVLFGLHTVSSYALYGVAGDGSELPVLLSPPGSVVPIDETARTLAAGARALFVADPAGSQGPTLYGATLDGSSPASALHPPLVQGGAVLSFQLDSSGTQALYRAEQDIAGLVELFRVPADGSAPPALRSTVRDSNTVVGSVSGFAPTPDGTAVVYHANQTAGRGLYAARLTGNPAPVHLAEVPSTLFRITPDSQRAVYTVSSTQLYSVPLDASAAPIPIVTLSHLATTTWRIAPDSSRVVHLHAQDQYSVGPERIFSTPVTGGGSTELNLPRTLQAEIEAFAISPDSTRVVYASAQETASRVELFSAPLAGGGAVKLSGALVAGGNVVADFDRPEISPDSSRVVYRADALVDGSFELFSAPLAGGAPPVELSALSGVERSVVSFTLSPDSAWVVYVADQDADDVHALYRTPLAGGGAPLELSALPGPDRDVDTSPFTFLGAELASAPYRVSPDSRWVVYRADQDVAGAFELYGVPLAGGAAPVRLTFDAAAGATVQLVGIAPDSARVLYLRSGVGASDLLAVPIHGGGSVHLNGSLAVVQPQPNPFTPDPLALFDRSGRWILFHAAPGGTDVRELFAAPLHGREAPIAINTPLPGGGAVLVKGEFRPDTTSVVYLAPQDEPGLPELYLTPPLELREGHHRPR